MSQSIYKSVLLDHFRNPRNKGSLEDMHVVRRGRNPRCGDELEVGFQHRNAMLSKVRFRGRGCSVCLASASMMTESVEGLSCQDASHLTAEVVRWFAAEHDTPPTPALAALDTARGHSARKKCVLLAWQALANALDTVIE